jgi:outer membrane murein-binding lipoprotein Lpp
MVRMRAIADRTEAVERRDSHGGGQVSVARTTDRPAFKGREAEGDGRRLGEGEQGAGEDDSSIGASIKALQKALRHATAAMTLDRYVGLLPEDVEAMRSEMAKAAQAHRAAASKSPAKKPKK